MRRPTRRTSGRTEVEAILSHITGLYGLGEVVLAILKRRLAVEPVEGEEQRRRRLVVDGSMRRRAPRARREALREGAERDGLPRALVVARVDRERDVAAGPDGAEGPRPVWKSNFTAHSCCIVASSSTPSTRRLLDGVVMPVPHRTTEPGRPRHRREMTQ